MSSKAELVRTINESVDEYNALMEPVCTLPQDTIAWEDAKKSQEAAQDKGAAAIVELSEKMVELSGKTVTDLHARWMIRGVTKKLTESLASLLTAAQEQ